MTKHRQPISAWELPTLLLALLIYTLWLMLVMLTAPQLVLDLIAACSQFIVSLTTLEDAEGLQTTMLGLMQGIALTFVLSWFSSLRHECIHGHPTPHRKLNTLLVILPLGVVDNYFEYRRSHLQHHNNRHLTDPWRDPESMYISAASWNQFGKPRRYFNHAYMTVFGRLLVSPALYLWRTVLGMRDDFKERRYRLQWLAHGVLMLVIILFVQQHMSLLIYGLACYTSFALTALRAFYEHRYDDVPLHRCIINRSNVLMRCLYLNNNYHALHHQQPTMPWYQLHQSYQAAVTEWHQSNGGFIENGYWQWIKNHSLRPVDHPVHPLQRKYLLAHQ